MAYKITLREIHRMILTEDEIQLLSTKTLMPRMEEVKNIFLFSCYTGRSYSDIEKLTLANISKGIDGEKRVFTPRTKIDTTTDVPLLSPALSILDKYTNHPIVIKSGKLLPVLPLL